MTFRITGLLDYFQRPEFHILENTALRKLDLFPFSGEGKEAPTPLERAHLKHWT
jgi:hypothetical protein